MELALKDSSLVGKAGANIYNLLADSLDVLVDISGAFQIFKLSRCIHI